MMGSKGYRMLDALFCCFSDERRFALRMGFLPLYKTFNAHPYLFARRSDELRLGWKDVIFAEGRYHEAMNRFLTENHDRIKAIFSDHKLHFIYGPYFQQSLARTRQFAYYAPYAPADSQHYGSEWVIRDLLTEGRKEDVPPMLLTDACYSCEGDVMFRLGFSLAHLMELEEAERFMLLEHLAQKIANFDRYDKQKFEDESQVILGTLPAKRPGHARHAWSYDYMWTFQEPKEKHSLRRGCTYEPPEEEKPAPPATADEGFEMATHDMLERIEREIKALQMQYGLSRAALIGLLGLDQPDEPLSRLRIDADYRIWLPDYHNMEVKMTPLVKAVYLLFLSHEEGILFKHLKEYRDELHNIYADVLQKENHHLSVEEIGSVIKLTNPLDNSINEKCARIREAFLKLFDEHLARYYVVNGERGKEKRIALPRHLVMWD